MSKFADLHIHTHFSDSSASPKEVVDEALSQNLTCIAITDHDTIDGIAPTIEAAQGTALEVIPAIELSAQANKRDVHVLGYFIDHTNPEFKALLNSVQETRVERMIQMIEKLKTLGMKNIELEEVTSLAQSKAVGRPHLAMVMMNKGWVKTIKQAFDKYLSDSGPAFVPKFKQTPVEAIKMIHRFGGVASLAHPMITNVDELIPGFVKEGLDAIEVYYANCLDSVVHYYEGIAKKNNILMTGGSDAHGKAKLNTYIGKATIEYELVQKLKDRKLSRHGQ